MTLTLGFYVSCFAIGLIGWLSAMLAMMDSLQKKAKSGNIQFSVKAFFVNEWINMLRSFIVILLALLLVKTFIDFKPEDLRLIKPAFFPIGYMGTDLVLKFLGVTNKWLNAALGFKANQTDIANGTTEAPTPATKP